MKPTTQSPHVLNGANITDDESSDLHVKRYTLEKKCEVGDVYYSTLQNTQEGTMR